MFQATRTSHADTGIKKPDTPAAEAKDWRPPFNLVRWFSLASFFIIAGVALGLGYISTRFVVEESIERDSMLTAQFVQAIGAAEIRHAGDFAEPHHGRNARPAR